MHETHSTPCRLLIHPPRDGPWNMAVDEYLLHWTARFGICCWRFYQWDPPTLSLGYFQPYADRDRHQPSRRCPAVRRASGGGAILHDRELTYSVAVPANHRLARRRQWLYESVHQTLIELLADRGVAARLCGSDAIVTEQPAPFLCFRRRSAGDLVIAAEKVAGSAQRRLSDAVLQHGSVLLGRSPVAPELPGLEELTGMPFPCNQLIDFWQSRLARTLGFLWRDEPLNEEEEFEVRRITVGKYAHRDWTLKTTTNPVSGRPAG